MFRNLFLPLNIQFFAADGGGGTPPTDPPTDPPADPVGDDDDKNKQGEKTFTQKEVDDIVKERIKRAEKDKQAAIDEAKKLAAMTEQQKKDYEFEQTKLQNEQLQAQINRFELGKVATSILAESGINATDDILEIVVKEDAEKTDAAVKAFVKLVDTVADDRMREKLKGEPHKRTKIEGGALTKKDIMNIKDGAERVRLIRENPHLFR